MFIQAKKKILFMGQFPPPVHGVSSMNSYILNSTTLSEYIDFDKISINTADRLDRIDKFSLAKLYEVFKNVLIMIKLISRTKYAFAYFTVNLKGLAFYRDMLYAAVIKCFGLKRLYHLHGYGVALASKSRVKRHLYRWYFKDAKVITLGEVIYKDIAMFVKRENVFVLYNAVPLSVDEGEIESIIALRRKKNKFGILFLSNMMESKGPHILLEVGSLLKSKGRIFNIYFAGAWMDNSYRKFFIKAIADYGLNENVILEGFCSGDKKKELLSKSDIFVFPTLRDTLSLVVLEAMEYALPILASNEGAIPEVVREGKEGFICPKHDIKYIAEIIEYLIEHKERRLEIGNNARNHFLENFSFDKYENKLLEIFQKD